jgi:hypothetical protein
VRRFIKLIPKERTLFINVYVLVLTKQSDNNDLLTIICRLLNFVKVLPQPLNLYVLASHRI